MIIDEIIKPILRMNHEDIYTNLKDVKFSQDLFLDGLSDKLGIRFVSSTEYLKQLQVKYDLSNHVLLLATTDTEKEKTLGEVFTFKELFDLVNSLISDTYIFMKNKVDYID